MLSNTQINDLGESIENYDFPCVAYDYKNKNSLILESIKDIEKYIKNLLMSDNELMVKDGLSNVLYWGYATSGYRDYRVSQFRNKVSQKQLIKAKQLFSSSKVPSMVELKKLGMPQYSGISFLSKIRMFLSPENSATLDKQIMKMKFTILGDKSVLNQFSHKTGQILPNAINSVAYEAWCEKLLSISIKYFEGQYRAVDVERGFFKIIRDGNQDYATEILVNS